MSQSDPFNIAVSQLAIIARSQAAVDRARIYTDGLAAHLANVDTSLEAASAGRLAVALGHPMAPTAGVETLQTERDEVARQHALAAATLTQLKPAIRPTESTRWSGL